MILGWSRSKSQPLSSRINKTQSPGEIPARGIPHRVLDTDGILRLSSAWWPVGVATEACWWWGWKWWWCGWWWWGWGGVGAGWGVDTPVALDVEGELLLLLLLILFSFFSRCLRWTWNNRNYIQFCNKANTVPADVRGSARKINKSNQSVMYLTEDFLVVNLVHLSIKRLNITLIVKLKVEARQCVMLQVGACDLLWCLFQRRNKNFSFCFWSLWIQQGRPANSSTYGTDTITGRMKGCDICQETLGLYGIRR